MKIYAISDLHLCISGAKPMEIFGEKWENYLDKIKQDWTIKVRDDDIVLIAGDISWAMKGEEAKKDLVFFECLPGKKIIIRGNHDYWWGGISKVRNLLPENVYALQNDALKFGDYIFCGSRGWTVPENPVTTEEDKKIFDREIIRMEMALATAKALQTNNEKIVVMIHFPPFNSKRQPSEFMSLFEKYNVNSVVYGHLHGRNSRSDICEKINGISYYLTSCDQVDNTLIEIK